MKTIILLVLLILPTTSIAGTAYWTGRFQRVENSNKNIGLWACQYKINGRKYTRVFENFCESAVNIYWEN